MWSIGERRTRYIPQDQSLVISPVKVNGVPHFGDFGGRADYCPPYPARGHEQSPAIFPRWISAVNLNPVVGQVGRAVFGCRARRSDAEWRPRRVEQRLPEEGATPKWDAGAPAYHGALSRHSRRCPIPASRGPSGNALGRDSIEGVATQPCAAKSVRTAL